MSLSIRLVALRLPILCTIAALVASMGAGCGSGGSAVETKEEIKKQDDIMREESLKYMKNQHKQPKR